MLGTASDVDKVRIGMKYVVELVVFKLLPLMPIVDRGEMRRSKKS
jgi:hypothetical protein